LVEGITPPVPGRVVFGAYTLPPHISGCQGVRKQRPDGTRPASRLRSSPRAKTTRTALDTIERSARTQATLSDDLLDLSRVVTGKLTLRIEPAELRNVVDNAVPAFSRMPSSRSARATARARARTTASGWAWPS
jgi:signal transduction histidine kinase